MPHTAPVGDPHMTLWNSLPQSWEHAFRTYAILFIGAAAVALYVALNVWWDRRRKRRLLEDSLQMTPAPTIRQVLSTTEPQPDFHVYQPGAAARPLAQDPFLERVRTLSTALRDDHAALNAGMVEDYQRIAAQLREVRDKREEIRAHGLELGKLYEKYRERETQLVAMLQGMRRILQSPPPEPQSVNYPALTEGTSNRKG